MNLEDLVSVSGMSGVFKMAANRNNGLIIEDLDNGKRKFASARKHQFTPLESIAIYTDDDDSVELTKVFRSMLEQIDDNPPVATNAKSDIVREYFNDILPNHDRDKVHVSDIKKLIKWFNFLKERNLLSLDEDPKKKGSDEEE
ncbi:DUF5606 domain-containing protein [Saprospiraceae bacterium]|jgi:hypothetical protein|nr:DUF5606 domain-containing protein [Bacteroidota bacterium]MDB4728120.1 DUF5606 domain-containing protein [Saprospiraceae bacterium]MDF1863852.1 DUF5606 domain-containing protein [Saprospiraceae bacterium]